MRRYAALAAAVVLMTATPSVSSSGEVPATRPSAKAPAVRAADTTRPDARRRPARAAPSGPTAALAPSPSSLKVSVVEHEVAPGETLGAIARKYGVSVSSIVIANKLRGSRAKLTIGQRLAIPQRPGAVPAARSRRPVDEPLPVSLVLGVPDFDVVPEFRWPVEGSVSSTFGRRRRSWHRGLDIRAEPGTPIVAAAAGVVIASGWEPRYGQRVTIGHNDGFVTLYAHNQRNLVQVGQIVEAGQVIATVGRTGQATGDHVHFEIRYDGRVYNPLYLLPMPPRTVQLDLTQADEAQDDE